MHSYGERPLILSKSIARQLSNPSGIIGGLAAPLWNKRNSALNDVAFDNLSLIPDDRVLEVGFGGGYLLGRISSVITDGFLAGIDISSAMVVFCKKRHRSLVRNGKLELKCARVESLPYPSENFTKVCTVNSIFYWQDSQQAFSEICRILQKNGTFVICFTRKTSLENKNFAKHIELVETDHVRQTMESLGFQGIQTICASDKHREFVCMTARK